MKDRQDWGTVYIIFLTFKLMTSQIATKIPVASEYSNIKSNANSDCGDGLPLLLKMKVEYYCLDTITNIF